MIAYICEQGAKISREGRRLIVKSIDCTRTLFVDHLEQVLLFGNVQLTPPALFLLLQERIDTVFLRADGRYMGRLANLESSNAFLRKKQFLLSDNQEFCLRTARCIVQAKLINQATVMSRIKRSRNQRAAGQVAIELKCLARKTQESDSLESLRGLEGTGAALYFRHLALAFNQDWGFTRRVRRPPTDPVNTVLSLLYTILINRCYAACRIAGLDPFPGCLHALSYGRHSLPLDLVEEFRAMLADTLTISLFNMRMLDWEDFESPTIESVQETESPADVMSAVLQDPIGLMSSDNSALEVSDLPGEQMADLPVDNMETKRPLLLRKPALKKVLTAFSKKMETEFFHPQAERSMNYSNALIFQARQYRRLIEGELDVYQPLMLR